MDVLVDVNVLRVGAPEMDAAPRLHALIGPVIGTEEFDHAAAPERNILIANGQTVENYTSMEEAAVMLALGSLYEFDRSITYMTDPARRPGYPRARMLRGRTVGIIGLGKIGMAIAERLQGFACTVQAHVRTPRDLGSGIRPVGLDALLQTSDVVVVATELNAHSGYSTRDPAADSYQGCFEIHTVASFQSAGFTAGFEAETLVTRLTRRGLRRIGVAGLHMMPHGFVQALGKGLGEADLVDVTDAVDAMMVAKSPEELVLVRVAAAPGSGLCRGAGGSAARHARD